MCPTFIAQIQWILVALLMILWWKFVPPTNQFLSWAAFYCIWTNRFAGKTDKFSNQPWLKSFASQLLFDFCHYLTNGHPGFIETFRFSSFQKGISQMSSCMYFSLIFLTAATKYCLKAHGRQWAPTFEICHLAKERNLVHQMIFWIWKCESKLLDSFVSYHANNKNPWSKNLYKEREFCIAHTARLFDINFKMQLVRLSKKSCHFKLFHVPCLQADKL